MTCSRASCDCRVRPGQGHEKDGKTYCCEECATRCTDESCECSCGE